MNDNGDVVCSCSENYTGEKCDTELCDDASFCKNGGTCTFNHYRTKICKCAPGYTGHQCEQKQPSSPCADHCKNNGKCTLSNNQLQDSTPVCECLPGYSGDVCQNSVCDDKECANEGSCMIDSKGRAKCNCTKFYTGKECKDCACKNGGDCVLTDKTVSCSCPAPFTGPLCEQKLQSQATEGSSSSTATIVGIIVGLVLLLATILVIVIIIVQRKSRNPFKHQRMNGMDVPNPVYRDRDHDEEDREINAHFDLEDHDHFANPTYDPRLYQAESTDVLLPKESDQENNIIEGNGNLRIYRKKDKNKPKGKGVKK